MGCSMGLSRPPDHARGAKRRSASPASSTKEIATRLPVDERVFLFGQSQALRIQKKLKTPNQLR